MIPAGHPAPESPLPAVDRWSLVNISTRGQAGSKTDSLIGGFVIDTPLNVLIRGVGPSLAFLGVENPLQDPVLTLFDRSGVIIATNRDWRLAIVDPEADGYLVEEAPIAFLNEIMRSVGAFDLKAPGDAGLYLRLESGLYTFRLSSTSARIGIGLNEIYAVPESTDPFPPALRVQRGNDPDYRPTLDGLAPTGCIDEIYGSSLRLVFEQAIDWEPAGGQGTLQTTLTLPWAPTRTGDIRHGRAGVGDSRGWAMAPRYEKTGANTARIRNLVTIDREGRSFIEECILSFATPGSGSFSYRWGTIAANGIEIATEHGSATGTFQWTGTPARSLEPPEAQFFRSFPRNYPDRRPSTLWTLRTTEHGRILTHGDGPGGSDENGAREAIVTEVEGQFVMHYDGCAADGWLACRAVSTDFVNWGKQGPIMKAGPPGSDDAGCVCSPWTIFDGSIWHMFYLAASGKSPAPASVPRSPYLTRKATSPSIMGPWIKHAEIEPLPYSPGPVIQIGDAFYQYFTAGHRETPYDPLQRTLGLASTTDLNAAWSIATTALLPPEEQIENASVYFEPANGIWFLFTNHVGIEPDGFEATDGVWVYWSRDPFQFKQEDKALVIDATTSTWAKGPIGMPSVVPAGDRLALFYDGSPVPTRSHLGRDIGLVFIDLPLYPPTGSPTP
ncbi:MAG: hypothetical protein R3F07_02470 [Opitutaceae bacterium]